MLRLLRMLGPEAKLAKSRCVVDELGLIQLSVVYEVDGRIVRPSPAAAILAMLAIEHMRRREWMSLLLLT